MQKTKQRGALGVFVAVMLAIVFGLISLQNISTTSLKLYLSGSKQHMEEARQLAYAGLRHYTHNFGSDEAIAQMILTYADNAAVVGKCSLTTPLPETLNPEYRLASPDTPQPNQEIEIRGVVVPYDCNRAISDNNYRATFQIVASINCGTGSSVASGCVKRSFVFNREDDNDGKYKYRPIKIPRPPSSTNSPPRGDSDNDSGGSSSGGDDDDEDSDEESSGSIGRQEVGF